MLDNARLMGPADERPDAVRYVARPPLPLFRALGVWHRLEYNRRSELDQNFEGMLPDDVLADIRVGFEAAVTSGEMRLEVQISGQHAVVLPSTWASPEAFAQAMRTHKGEPVPMQLRVDRGLHEVPPVNNAPSFDELAAYSQADFDTEEYVTASEAAGMFGANVEAIEAVPLVPEHAAEAAYRIWQARKLDAVVAAPISKSDPGQPKDNGKPAPGRGEKQPKLYVIADSLFPQFANGAPEAWTEATMEKHNKEYPKNRVELREARRKLKSHWDILQREHRATNVLPMTRPEKG